MIENNKKELIIQTIKKYSQDGVLDVSSFRNNEPKLYASIPYYFGSVDKMLKDLNLTKLQNGAYSNKMTLRNKLAYEYLVKLRKNYTLEEIADKYNVSRALINQQYQALEIMAKKEKIKL